MALNAASAHHSEIVVTGTQKHGCFIKRETLYTFWCALCPAEIKVRRADLKRHSGRCRPCADKQNGQLSSQRNRKQPYEALYNRFLYDRGRAGQETDITFADFVDFTKIKECHYCGRGIEWAECSLACNGYRYNLDRTNNCRGYFKDNVVVCCWRCNETKSDRFTYNQFVKIGNVIRSFEGGTCGA